MLNALQHIQSQYNPSWETWRDNRTVDQWTTWVEANVPHLKPHATELARFLVTASHLRRRLGPDFSWAVKPKSQPAPSSSSSVSIDDENFFTDAGGDGGDGNGHGGGGGGGKGLFLGIFGRAAKSNPGPPDRDAMTTKSAAIASAWRKSENDSLRTRSSTSRHTSPSTLWASLKMAVALRILPRAASGDKENVSPPSSFKNGPRKGLYAAKRSVFGIVRPSAL